MKKILLYVFAIIIVLVLLFLTINFKATKNYLGWSNNSQYSDTNAIKNENMAIEELPSKLVNKIHNKAKGLKNYASIKGLDTSVFFIINMEQASGKDRFYIYDWNQKKITAKSLVTHGRCNETVLKGRKYSNVVGGGCTSLGRYKIGNAYQGKFGLAYKLYGLDTSNSNAFERFVVMHSHECVPDNEVDPYPICQSDGCPTVSPLFLQKLAKIIDKSSKPILMEIFDDNY